MGNKKLNQAEQIMKKYRDGVNRIELRYKKIDKNNKNLEKKIKELDEKIEYEKSFIEKLESEGHQANLELINKAKARLESAVNEKKSEEEATKNEEKNSIEALKRSKVKLPSGREVTRAEKDEIDKNDLKEEARRALRQESIRISKELEEKNEELVANRKAKSEFRYEFEKDKNGNSTGKVLNEDVLDKITKEFEKLRKEMTELSKTQEDCNKYLEEFRQMDAKKMETFSKAWSETAKEEQILEQEGKKPTDIELNVSENKAIVNAKEIEGEYKIDRQTRQTILEDKELEITKVFENDKKKLKYLDYSLIEILKEQDPKLAKDYLTIIRDGGDKNIESVLSEFKGKINIKYKFEKGSLLNFQAKKVARMAHKLGIAEIEGIKEKGFFEGILSKINKFKLTTRKVEVLDSGEEKVQTSESEEENKERKQGLEGVKVDNKDNKIEKRAAEMQQNRTEQEVEQEAEQDRAGEVKEMMGEKGE